MPLPEPYIDDLDFRLFNGDALDVLRELPDESVDCAATSPPFYGLRDYGVDGQIGLEASPDEWVARLVAVFGEVRRVLKPQATLWVECGDSYASQGGPQVQQTKQHRGSGYHGPNRALAGRDGPGQSRGNRQGDLSRPASALKAKDLLGSPWLLAFALRADGWWLRQAIIWHKPNAMPESATDRCTTAHSYVFLLSKQARYFFDAEAISEPAEWARWGDQTVPKYEGTDTSSGWMQPKTKGELRALRTESGSWESGGLEAGKSSWPDGRKTGYTIADHEAPQESDLFSPGNRRTNGQKERTDERRGFDNRLERVDGRKNARSVWTVPTEGYPEAHFATWPQALVERILKAGCPQGGTVLDPFMGSGTTALVARKLGRKSIGIELNPDYCELAARRLAQQSLLAEPAAQ